MPPGLLAQLGLLLLVATLVAIACARLRLPWTVGLVVAGMALAAWPSLVTLQPSRELVYAVLLPPLVFEAALHLHWPMLRRDLPAVGLLATAGVVLAAALVAIGMHGLAAWPWALAIPFGTLIAATDPVSVIATFREARVGGRLALLVEAESLLNDGTAAVLFAAAVGWASGSAAGWWLPGLLAWSMAGALACGWLIGRVATWLAGRAPDGVVAMAASALAAYGSFHLAEHVHASGVLAALAAGLAFGHGRAGLPVPTRESLESAWDSIAFLANATIFLLIGRSLAHQPLAQLWWPALLAIALVLAGRALSVYPLCALLARTRVAVAMGHQHVLFWGGLRGALALALALGLPPAWPGRGQLVAVTCAVVAFSIFVQGITVTPLMRRLGQLPDGR